MVTYPRRYGGGLNEVWAVGEENIKDIFPSRGGVNCLAEAGVIECVYKILVDFFEVFIALSGICIPINVREVEIPTHPEHGLFEF